MTMGENSSLVIMIVNPAARKVSVRRIRFAVDFLEGRGYKTELLLTKRRGDAEIFARDASKKKPLMIIAAGGDGTINEVINGMAFSDVPLAILPLGTTNVLARELGISMDVEDCLEVALSGAPKDICLGRIETGTVSRYFCLMAGIGFDGRAVYEMNPLIKKVSGEAAYFLSGIKNLINYRPDNISVRVNEIDYPAHSTIIGKISRYGGDYRITSDARLSDPFFYSCIFRGRKRSDVLRYVFGVFKGTHLKYKDIEYLKCSSVEITGRAHIQIDGDYFGVSPARISIVKDALKLIW